MQGKPDICSQVYYRLGISAYTLASIRLKVNRIALEPDRRTLRIREFHGISLKNHDPLLRVLWNGTLSSCLRDPWRNRIPDIIIPRVPRQRSSSSSPQSFYTQIYSAPTSAIALAHVHVTLRYRDLSVRLKYKDKQEYAVDTEVNPAENREISITLKAGIF